MLAISEPKKGEYDSLNLAVDTLIFKDGVTEPNIMHTKICTHQLTRVNSTNVLDEGLRIGGIGSLMNSKVKSIKQGVYRK
jgi:hypothetical protein